MGWGFMDGIRSPEQHAPTYDPGTGALVTLMPAGAAAPPAVTPTATGSMVSSEMSVAGSPLRSLSVKEDCYH